MAEAYAYIGDPISDGDPNAPETVADLIYHVA